MTLKTYITHETFEIRQNYNLTCKDKDKLETVSEKILKSNFKLLPKLNWPAVFFSKICQKFQFSKNNKILKTKKNGSILCRVFRVKRKLKRTENCAYSKFTRN